MQLSPEELEEFRLEAFELLDHAEKSLLALDAGGIFSREYDAIFRAFHNLKGSAGMLEMRALQSHMHQLETILTQQKDGGVLSHELIDHFLKGCDRARGLFGPDQAETPPTAVEVPVAMHVQAATKATATTPDDVLGLFLQYLPDLEDHYAARGQEAERQALRSQISKLLFERKSA